MFAFFIFGLIFGSLEPPKQALPLIYCEYYMYTSKADRTTSEKIACVRNMFKVYLNSHSINIW